MSASTNTGGENRPKAGEVASGMAASPADLSDVLAMAQERHHPLDLAAQRAIEGISSRRMTVSRYQDARQ